MGTWEEIKGNTASITSLKRYGLMALVMTLFVFVWINTHEQEKIMSLTNELNSMKKDIQYASIVASDTAKHLRVSASKAATKAATKAASAAGPPKALVTQASKAAPGRATDPRAFHTTNTGTESKHLMLEVFNANPVKLNDEQYIRNLFSATIRKLGMTEVSMSSVGMVPQGVSAVALLTESHMSIHTWPELGYAALDVFTCGPTNPLDALQYMAEGFDVEKPERDMLWGFINRGKSQLPDEKDLDIINADIYSSKQLVASKKSQYQEVTILETSREYPKEMIDKYKSLDKSPINALDSIYRDIDGEYKKNRCLYIDGVIMSCLADERAYHETLIHPAMLAHPNPTRVAVLGGGEGASLREIYKHKSVEKAYMLELDNTVIELCKKHMPTMSAGAFDNPKTDLRLGDASLFFTDHPDEAKDLDVLFLDILDINEAPPGVQEKLAGAAFIKGMKKSLSKDGVIVVQMGELPQYQKGDPDYGNQVGFMIECLKHFKYGSAYSAPIASFRGSWLFFIVTDSKKTYDNFNKRTAAEFKEALNDKFYDPSEISYISDTMLTQFQGVEGVFDQIFCATDLSNRVQYKDEEVLLKKGEAEDLCRWARSEAGDEKGLNVLLPDAEYVFDPMRAQKWMENLMVARKLGTL
ncbi:hypothetical protein TrVE_jg5684 [Triparma verrucosa]|uniref:PABS domain-containing protein n=1 Tax=Triparma verrucosa TaxID=1606542 RepID=A0A9W7FJ72_9STRA|nr:hypothetical protein TrVE_jg5684 [Triparma verrucosa]